MSYAPIVEWMRGDWVESVHAGAVAVCDPQGALLAWHGDPQAATFLRSSAKPLQVLPLLTTGAAEHFGLNDAEIAVACASHSGTDGHVEAVRSILDRAGLEEAQLQCGSHPPYDPETRRALRQRGEQPTPIRHNCSGKHAGMLMLAKYLGLPPSNYLDREQEVQQRILNAVAVVGSVPEAEIRVAIDGCSAPNFALPIRNAALAFARLAEPGGLMDPYPAACRRVFAAMTAHPSLVGGPGRLDTRLMEAAPGRLLAKGGAEAYHTLALKPGASLRAPGALGVALKIADGASRPVAPVVLAMLEQLEVFAPEEIEALGDLATATLTNHRGLEVGKLNVLLRLGIGEPPAGAA